MLPLERLAREFCIGKYWLLFVITVAHNGGALTKCRDFGVKPGDTYSLKGFVFATSRVLLILKGI